jgi:hypothetical protein
MARRSYHEVKGPKLWCRVEIRTIGYFVVGVELYSLSEIAESKPLRGTYQQKVIVADDTIHLLHLHRSQFEFGRRHIGKEMILLEEEMSDSKIYLGCKANLEPR